MAYSTTGKFTKWRYVTGAFQVTIPVTTEEAILPSDENTLAIMKWRLDNMSPEYRWYPVLKKYLAYLSARVDGSGGDAAGIVASQTGIPLKIRRQAEYEEYTGKVCEVIYDCFADFEGFILESCCARHSFKSCERAIGEIALLSCKERLLVSVYVDKGNHNKIFRIIIRG